MTEFFGIFIDLFYSFSICRHSLCKLLHISQSYFKMAIHIVSSSSEFENKRNVFELLSYVKAMSDCSNLIDISLRGKTFLTAMHSNLHHYHEPSSGCTRVRVHVCVCVASGKLSKVWFSWLKSLCIYTDVL